MSPFLAGTFFFLIEYPKVSGKEEKVFTGIIEEVGTIDSIAAGGESAVLTVAAHKVLQGTQIGDSIAVNGVCLTVTSMQGGKFQADVMAETLRRSSLGSLHRGSQVNLERAMAADGRFGGHIVAGHIDGTGTILSTRKEGNAMWVEIGKGSIAIDGISLTVALLTDKSFSVSVIPHTGEETTLLHKKKGDIVNLENDPVGKYVERFLTIPAEKTNDTTQEKGITLEMLTKYGF